MHFRDILLVMVSSPSLTQHGLLPEYLFPLADLLHQKIYNRLDREADYC